MDYILTEEDRRMLDQCRENGIGKVVSQELLDLYHVKREETVTISTTYGSCKASFYWPEEDKRPLPLFVNAHGGGFVKGKRQQDIVFSRNISSRLGCIVMDVDYTPAPELRFPGQIYQTYEAVCYALEHSEEWNIDRDRVAMGGHSAGGSLTAGVALLAGQRGDFRLRLQILDYACLNLYEPVQLKRNAYANPRLTPERSEFYNRMYLTREEDKLNPLASPLLAPDSMIRTSPETLIIVCDNDFFCDEGLAYGKRLAENGVTVTMKNFMDSSHGFVVQRKGEFEAAERLILRALKHAFDETKTEENGGNE